MPADPPPALPGAVLFACNFNRVRSAMAESLMKLMYGTQVYVDSCGLRQDEEAEPDPFAVAVMEEVGADMSRHRPKTFDDLEDGSFDLVVSLTPEAQHRAGGCWTPTARRATRWPPASASASASRTASGDEAGGLLAYAGAVAPRPV